MWTFKAVLPDAVLITIHCQLVSQSDKQIKRSASGFIYYPLSKIQKSNSKEAKIETFEVVVDANKVFRDFREKQGAK